MMVKEYTFAECFHTLIVLDAVILAILGANLAMKPLNSRQ